MIKLSGMTVTGLRTTMTSPTVPPTATTAMTTIPSSPNAIIINNNNVNSSGGNNGTSPSLMLLSQHSHQLHHPHQQLYKTNSRLSNFSVASLLADTRPRSPSEMERFQQLAPTNLSSTPSSTTSPRSQGSSPASPPAAHHPHHPFHPHHHAHLLHAAHAAAAAHHAAQQQHQHAQQAHHPVSAHLPNHIRHPSLSPIATLHTPGNQQLQQNMQEATSSTTASSSATSPVNTSTASTATTTTSVSLGTIGKLGRHSPTGSPTESEIDYDSNPEEEEDSIVDIEDMNHNESPRSTPDGMDSNKSIEGPSSMPSSPHILSPAAFAASGPGPIRPTPFSALAAAAVASWGMGGGVPWPGARQMPPFGPPGLFPGQGFGGGGKFTKDIIEFLPSAIEPFFLHSGQSPE